MVSGLVGAWNSHISHISLWIGGPVNQIPSSVAWQTKSTPRTQLKSQSLSSDLVKPPKPPWNLPFLHRYFHLFIAGSGFPSSPQFRNPSQVSHPLLSSHLLGWRRGGRNSRGGASRNFHRRGRWGSRAFLQGTLRGKWPSRNSWFSH